MNRRERYAMARDVSREAGGMAPGAKLAYGRRSECLDAGSLEGFLLWHECWTTIIDTMQAVARFGRRRRGKGDR